MCGGNLLGTKDLRPSDEAGINSEVGRLSSGTKAVGERAVLGLFPAIPAGEHSGISNELREAWLRDPVCLGCGQPIVSADDAALLVGPQRVAHRVACFVPALLRHHPYLRRLATHARIKEGESTPVDRNGAEESELSSGGGTHGGARG